MHKRMIAMVAVALAAATVFADYTYYVRQNGGSDSNNGTSYETAFATFDKARKTAYAKKDETIKTIYIYPGEYHVAPKDADGKPYAQDQVIGIGCKNLRFIGVDDDGTGDVRTDADPTKVILDGDNVMRIITSYNTDYIHLRNLTFQNGLSKVGGNYYWPGKGGLIYLAGNNNVISNCVFKNGVADIGGGIYCSGAMYQPVYDCKFYDCVATNAECASGAVHLNSQGNCNQTYVRCDFVGCASENGEGVGDKGARGGALYCSTGASSTNGFVLVSCNFVSNSCVSGIGGAICGPVHLATNCTFVGNSAQEGSVNGMWVLGVSNRTNTYVDCTFVGNVGLARFGSDTIDIGHHVGGALVNYSSFPMEVRRCVFADNVSHGFCGVIGRRDNGAVRLQMCDTVVTNNHILGDVIDPIMENATKDLSTYSFSGVVRATDGSVVSNCVFSGNSSYGGAYVLSLGNRSKVSDSIFTDNVGKECPGKTGVTTVWGGVLTGDRYNLIRNCLICRNWRQAATGNGAAVFFSSLDNSSNRIENCTICDNLAKMDPGQYSVGPRLSGKGSVIVNSVCLGNKTEAGREVNLCLQEGAVQSNCYTTVATAAGYKDPKFRGRAKGDYRLRRTSPLRDAGQRLDWMTPDAKDLAGQGRVNGENPDIGCYEYWWYSTGMLLFVE